MTLKNLLNTLFFWSNVALNYDFGYYITLSVWEAVDVLLVPQALLVRLLSVQGALPFVRFFLDKIHFAHGKSNCLGEMDEFHTGLTWIAGDFSSVFNPITNQCLKCMQISDFMNAKFSMLSFLIRYILDYNSLFFCSFVFLFM